MALDPLLTLLALAATARRKLRRTVKPSPHRSWSAILAALLPIERLLARLIRDGQLLAWLEGGTELVKSLPAVEPHQALQNVASRRLEPEKNPNRTPIEPKALPPVSSRPPLPPEPLFPDRSGDAPPPIRLPAIEKGAQYLRNRLAYTPEEFAALDDDAREVGFTVAKAMSLDAVEKVRDALAEDVAQGGTLRAFRGKIADVIDESALSPAKVEALYRTHVARAYSAGQLDVHDHPLMRGSFDYVMYNATHDGRVRPEHLALESMGMKREDGTRTAIYRADDPVIRRYWGPWDWNCRCVCIFISTADAARYGVREAIEWERTGIPPANPEYVPDPGFPLPSGWVPVGRLRPMI